jgi:hypothetical protein
MPPWRPFSKFMGLLVFRGELSLKITTLNSQPATYISSLNPAGTHLPLVESRNEELALCP